MLAAIGVDSVDELFADIPASLRASGLQLPPPESEAELSLDCAIWPSATGSI
jgi:glycine cleavage system pyridoxal-binding protein P